MNDGIRRRVLLAAVGIIAAGCSSFLSPTKSMIYTIDPIPGTIQNEAGAPIGIDSVELPAGFDRKEIVVRKANNELDVRGTQQWPSTLSDVVLHALAFDLASRLPVGMVILPGEPKPAAVRSIDVAFEQIGAGPDAKVTIDAIWNQTHREHIEVPIANLDSASVAAG